MNVDELLSRAWAAVRASGVPQQLQAVALKEAIDFLRAGTPTGGTPLESPGRASRAPSSSTQRTTSPIPTHETPEDAFFGRLALESGAGESDLRDLLHVTADSRVHVTPPTKDLGRNVAEQARTVIALVASARGIGLEEKPVDADAVREELTRKRCYQANNFAGKHLGPLRGFNAGSKRTEIVLTSRWVEDFRAAIERVHGRDSDT